MDLVYHHVHLITFLILLFIIANLVILLVIAVREQRVLLALHVTTQINMLILMGLAKVIY